MDTRCQQARERKAEVSRAFEDLAVRVLGEIARNRFVFRSHAQRRDGTRNKPSTQIVTASWFCLQDLADDKILVSGSDKSSLGAGLGWYMRHCAHLDFDPIFNPEQPHLPLPLTARSKEPLPRVGKPIRKETSFRYRYALNFCTYSYSMAFWTWREYEPFLDWLALAGVNLALDTVGQEAVTRDLLLAHGYSDEEVRSYLPGPAHLAWFHMINLCGVEGPLPPSWFAARIELANRIHQRMLDFGMDPVMPGFAGAVPSDLAQHDPRARVIELGDWFGMKRPAMLKVDAAEPESTALFREYAADYYRIQDELFGPIARFFDVDPYHEGEPPKSVDVPSVYASVQDSMLSHRADSIWVLQQWEGNVTEVKLRALIKPENVLVLDLHSEVATEEGPAEHVGTPWIWCALMNFGGRKGLEVPLDIIARTPEIAGQYQHLAGIGLTAEALEGSPVAFELLFDAAWEQHPLDIPLWLEAFCLRRYGTIDPHITQAWRALTSSVLRSPSSRHDQEPCESVICAVPSSSEIDRVSPVGYCKPFYDTNKLDGALSELERSDTICPKSAAYQSDLIDLRCQILTCKAREAHKNMCRAFASKDIDGYRKASTEFLELITKENKLLSHESRSDLETWIMQARNVLPQANREITHSLIRDGLSLITIWSMDSGELMDYSNRQWHGLLSGYYRERWRIHIENRINELENGIPQPDPDWFEFGRDWVLRMARACEP